jgi:hypothetical protein
MTDAADVISLPASLPASLVVPDAPPAILDVGPAAAFAWRQACRGSHIRSFGEAAVDEA